MSEMIIHTCPNPEDNAMLQALYSRSSKSVEEHLEKLKSTGSGKFMEQYYVGYGHNSIADCGFITMYFEGISMLAAKALEDSPLYNGQECSSRYIDYSDQPFYNPYVGNKHEGIAEALLQKYRAFYIEQLPIIKAHLTTNIPIQEGQDEKTYEKAISAKAFDILRGYLPCGATTNVSWTTSLRKAREHLELLSHHPLREISTLAMEGYRKLREQHPTSFPELDSKDRDVTSFGYDVGYENYYSIFPEYFDADYHVLNVSKVESFDAVTFSSPLGSHYAITGSDRHRPRKCTPHKHDIRYKSSFIHVTGLLDFGSFRDVQRHRGGYCSMPLVDNAAGFHEWYYDMLPESSQDRANELFDEIMDFLYETIPRELGDTADAFMAKLRNQYLLPMGTVVEVDLVYDLKQAVYVTELRTSQTVHPTLRAFAQNMVTALDEGLPYAVIHADMEPDKFNIKRGNQDISEVK